MRNIRRIAVSIFALAATMATAQVVVKTDAGDLKLRLIGRTNFDAATYFAGDAGKNAHDHYINGMVMNDTRLGVVATLDEGWNAKAEICYTNKTISFRDLFIGKKINDNSSVQIGNFFMPFGAKQLGLQYKFVEDATVDYTLCPSRKIGAAYFYTSDAFNFTGGFFSDGNVDSKAVNQGYSIAAKAIARPIMNENTILHIGVARMFTDSPNSPSFSGIVPTTIHSNKLMDSGSIDAINYWRQEVEAMLFAGKFHAEVHYQGATVNTPGEDNYKVNGIYTQVSFLLKGEKQNYNKKTGLAASASPKSLELLARFDHLDLNGDSQLNDVTVGLNYFISKNLNVKLNYAHGIVKDADAGYDFIQTRLQFSF